MTDASVHEPSSAPGIAALDPVGRRLVEADLPPARPPRWVARRKALVVAAVEQGLLSRAEACRRYGLSGEEFDSWQTLARRDGERGLRATKLHRYRRRGRKRG